MNKKLLFILLAMSVSVLMFSAGCSNDDDDSSPTASELRQSDCIGCHTDQEMLIATMLPDTTTEPEESGEG
ncbi:MAG: hypothetical protein KDB65_12310 [Calditrichaeota bacterium]|nr:hypothetical protein [Calditrichota bacterium]MCB9367595.1 hypothetical protein [Calditrichota bacterium]